MIIYDTIIIGSGPAGLVSGLYGGRAGLKTLLFDKGNSGGTGNIAPLVENFPGFDRINGRKLMEYMDKQSRKYTTIKEYSEVTNVKYDGNYFIITSKDEKYYSYTLLLCTGSLNKRLNVPGEGEYLGRGVSYCAMCDGSFFIDKKVVIVGGGNSAATQALYLNNINVKPTIIHRRDSLRADKKLQDELKEENISILYDSSLEKIQGDGRVEEVIVKNRKTNNQTTIKTDGVFIAIGYNPNNKLAYMLNVNCNDLGYIKVDETMKTNVKGVYAAGDITGGLKQILTAAAQGAIAINDIQESIKMYKSGE